MASKVEICNYALQELGASFITSLTEDTKNARECNLRFDSVRRSLLRMSLWNFAIKRVDLSRETSTPAFNYSYQFALPSDFLKLVMTKNEEQHQSFAGATINPLTTVQDINTSYAIDKYRVEGKKLVSDSSEVSIIYVSDTENTGEWDSLFTELFTRLLTARIARKITGSAKESQIQMKIFEEELAFAESVDGQEGVFDKIQISTFLSTRH